MTGATARLAGDRSADHALVLQTPPVHPSFMRCSTRFSRRPAIARIRRRLANLYGLRSAAARGTEPRSQETARGSKSFAANARHAGAGDLSWPRGPASWQIRRPQHARCALCLDSSQHILVESRVEGRSSASAKNCERCLMNEMKVNLRVRSATGALAAPTESTNRPARRWWLPWACCFVFFCATGFFALEALSPIDDEMIKKLAEERGLNIGKAESSSAALERIGLPSGEGCAALEISLESKGYIVPISLIQVSPKVSGTVTNLNIKEGMAVEKVRCSPYWKRLNTGRPRSGGRRKKAANARRCAASFLTRCQAKAARRRGRAARKSGSTRVPWPNRGACAGRLRDGGAPTGR